MLFGYCFDTNLASSFENSDIVVSGENAEHINERHVRLDINTENFSQLYVNSAMYLHGFVREVVSMISQSDGPLCLIHCILPTLYLIQCKLGVTLLGNGIYSTI